MAQKGVKTRVVARGQVVTVVKGDGMTTEHAMKGSPEFITWQTEARQWSEGGLGTGPDPGPKVPKVSW